MADEGETSKQQPAAAGAQRPARERETAATRRLRRRLWQVGGLALVVAAVIAVVVVATSGAGPSHAPKKHAGEQVPGQRAAAALFAGIPQHGWTLGDPKAPYTMYEFADLQCPVCREYTAAGQPSVIDAYVKSGKLKIVYQPMAFLGTDSIRAWQMAGEVAKQDLVWQYADLFYANQGQENTGYVTDDFLRKVGSGVAGLDVEQAMAARGSAETGARMKEAERLMQQYRLPGTPGFVVGRTGGAMKVLAPRSFDGGTMVDEIAKAIA